MIYPKYLKKGSLVGVTAPSDGITDEIKIKTFENGKKMLQDIANLKVVFTDNVFTSDNHGRSSSGFERAMQFNDLVSNKKIDWIVSATGGNYLVEMLDFVDFNAIKKHPVFVQGYSDNTSLLVAITTICDVATIYGSNFSIFGMEKYGLPHYQNLDLLFNKTKEFYSHDLYESEFSKKNTGLEYFALDKTVCYKNGYNQKSVKFKGRMIGGCSDVIFSLIGTPYEKILQYIEKYKEDGIIFYLESFNTNDVDLYMHLWQMKKAGYFKYCTGIMFGRPLFFTSFDNQSYYQVCEDCLKSLNIPIIFDTDIGHRQPCIPIVNGAFATVESADSKGKITYEFI